MRLLVIEESDGAAGEIVREFESRVGDLTWERVASAGALEEALERCRWDAVVSAPRLQDLSAVEALNILRRNSEQPPLFCVGANAEASLVVATIKAGASDFVDRRELSRLYSVYQEHCARTEIEQTSLRIREVLSESQELALLITEYSDDLITLVDMRGTIVFLSASVRRMMGEDPAQYTGIGYLDRVHPDDLPGLIDSFPRTLAGDTVSFCNRIRHADGTWRWLEGWSRILSYKNAPCTLAVARDVTDRKRAEALRDAQNRILEMIAADAPLEDTLAMMTDLAELQKDATGDVATRLARIAIDRKQTGEALRVSEERYRKLFQGAHDIIYTHDMNGNFLSFNPAAEKLLGYTHEELLSMNLSQILVPQEFVVTRDGLVAEGAAEPPAAVRLEIVTRDGRRITLEAVLQFATVNDVRVVHGIARDMTDRKRAETERQSHLRFLQRMERIDEAIRHTDDLETMIGDVLDTVLSLFECDRAWLLTPCDPDSPTWKVSMERTRPKYSGAAALRVEIPTLPEVAEAFRLALASADPISFVEGSRHCVPVETMKQFQVQSQLVLAVHPGRGSPWLFGMHQCSYARVWNEQEMALLKEIGRRVAEGLRSLLLLKDLRAGEERYRSLVESLSEIVFTADCDGNLTYLSPAIDRMSSYEAGQLDGHSFFDIVHPDDVAEVRARFRRTLIGIEEPSEFRVFDNDGTVHWIRVSSRPRFENGRLIGVGGVIADITDRRLAELEIRQLNQDLERRVKDRTVQLEAMVEELDAFSFSVSHDLRAPLRTIHGFSHVLIEQHGDQLSPEGRAVIERIVATTRHMADLIRDLLDLAKIARTQMARQPVDLSAVAESIAAELQRDAGERRVEFHITPGLIVQGDAGLLRTALQNLLENAWKYTSKHRSARIELGMNNEDLQSVYFVRDDGAGFDMAYAVNLFGAFQRLHSAADFEGTGVGLATVQRIIHRHGGRIWADSSPEQGATFYFTLDAMG